MIDHFKRDCLSYDKENSRYLFNRYLTKIEFYIMCLLKLDNLNVSVSFVIQLVFIRLVSQPKCRVLYTTYDK